MGDDSDTFAKRDLILDFSATDRRATHDARVVGAISSEGFRAHTE
jgi:hypothetical protein